MIDDDRLATLLGDAPSAERALAIARGAASAPDSERPRAWHQLVDPAPSEALAEALDRARSEAVASFDVDPPEPDEVARRVRALRGAIAARGLTAFLIPRADEFQGEYVSACDERLCWATGFTGSAGAAVIGLERAALFIDGRYTLQAERQTPAELFEYVDYPSRPVQAWAAEALGEGDLLGYDPRVTTPKRRVALERAAAKAKFSLRALEANLVDELWQGRPERPIAPIAPHPLEWAGEPAGEKIASYRAALRERGADWGVISAPDALAWLFNVRGADVPFTPISLGYALIAADPAREGAARLYLDRRKCLPEARAHFETLGVAIDERDALFRDLEALGAVRCALDERTASAALVAALERGGAEALLGLDPCAIPRAKKNEAELEGARRAHELDGAALVEFFAWLEAALQGGEPVDEISAAQRLLGFRRAHSSFRDRSFPSISGVGPNGAVIHYRATPKTNLPLRGDTLYLIDSGAQYAFGTTDITRTIAVGAPSQAMRAHYTAVLRGHIALSRARFPSKTLGVQLDAIARAPLWEAGLDFRHGTGHGVGSYLSVHEGPQGISPRSSSIGFEPGMIVSNEPGYYRSGAYGIRIENLMATCAAEAIEGGEIEMLGFETLTLAPYDRRLIDRDALTAPELAWIESYHAEVSVRLDALLSAEARSWLERATAPLIP